MPLVRAWTRGLSGASGAAVLVPGAIFAAILLLALAGSFGRLGGLGQALSGPALPGSTAIASTAPSFPNRGPALLPVVASSASIAPAAVRTAPIAGGGPAGKRPSAAPGGRSPSGGGGGEPTPPSSPAPPAGTGGCGSCAPPSAHPTLVDQVVSIGTSVTSKLPGAVGQLTTQLLKQLGATIDKILPTDRRPNLVTRLGSTLSQLKLP